MARAEKIWPKESHQKRNQIASGFGKLIQQEWWKRTAALGWIASIAIIIRYSVTGDGPDMEMVYFVGVLIVGAAAWQGLKRGTWSRDAAEFNGTQEEANDVARRRADDEHGGEFAGR